MQQLDTAATIGLRGPHVVVRLVFQMKRIIYKKRLSSVDNYVVNRNRNIFFVTTVPHSRRFNLLCVSFFLENFLSTLGNIAFNFEKCLREPRVVVHSKYCIADLISLPAGI